MFCKEHYTPEDYKENIQCPTRKMELCLKNMAIPSIFWLDTEESASSMAERNGLFTQIPWVLLDYYEVL